MSDYQEPVVLPPDDDSVSYPIPAPDYVPPGQEGQEQEQEQQPPQEEQPAKEASE